MHVYRKLLCRVRCDGRTFDSPAYEVNRCCPPPCTHIIHTTRYAKSQNRTNDLDAPMSAQRDHTNCIDRSRIQARKDIVLFNVPLDHVCTLSQQLIPKIARSYFRIQLDNPNPPTYRSKPWFRDYFRLTKSYQPVT